MIKTNLNLNLHFLNLQSQTFLFYAKPIQIECLDNSNHVVFRLFFLSFEHRLCPFDDAEVRLFAHTIQIIVPFFFKNMHFLDLNQALCANTTAKIA